MRFVIATILFVTLAAHAQESADMASTISPSWNKNRDMVSDQTDRAKVKAFIRDLLGEDRAPQTEAGEENTGAAESAD